MAAPVFVCALVPLLEGLRYMLVSAHRPLGFGREAVSTRFRRVCAFMPMFYAELNVAERYEGFPLRRFFVWGLPSLGAFRGVPEA